MHVSLRPAHPFGGQLGGSRSKHTVWALRQPGDFIIVGRGPAGCALAVDLAHSTTHPRVLLLEADIRGDDKCLHVDGQRWSTFLNKEMNWGYKTVPQEHCNGRQIDYSRGKVRVGSTAIKFGVLTVGSREE